MDPTTGTLVISWRDARNDPANTLVATYIATSIDGGNTFSAQVYANPANDGDGCDHRPTRTFWARRATTVRPRTIVANAPYGFGTSMGLAVYAGQVYPIWAGNFDEAYFNSAMSPPA